MQLSIFSAEEHPVSPSATPDSALDWMTRVANSCSPLVPLLQGIGPAGWFGRTSPASCPATEDGTLVPSSGSWASSGMGSPTEFLTLSLCEWTATLAPSHSDGSVCSLSDVLVTGEVPQRYFLSAKACAGILRRAEARGRALPPHLLAALKAVAEAGTQGDGKRTTPTSSSGASPAADRAPGGASDRTKRRATSSSQARSRQAHTPEASTDKTPTPGTSSRTLSRAKATTPAKMEQAEEPR